MYLASTITALLSEIVAVSTSGRKRRYRVSIGVSASAQNRGRYGIFHVAINCVEREHAVGEVRDIAAHPELVGAIGGVVLPVSAELIRRR